VLYPLTRELQHPALGDPDNQGMVRPCPKIEKATTVKAATMIAVFSRTSLARHAGDDVLLSGMPHLQ
jgi:hypothetical protein